MSECKECGQKGNYSEYTHCTECHDELHIKCAVETGFSRLCQTCVNECNTSTTEVLQPLNSIKNSGLMSSSAVGTCNTCSTRGTYGVDGFTACRECYCDVCNGCSRIIDQIPICLKCRREKAQTTLGEGGTTDSSYTETTTVAHSSSEDPNEDEDKDSPTDDELRQLLPRTTSPTITAKPTAKPSPLLTPTEVNTQDGWQIAKSRKSPITQEPAARVQKPPKILSPNGIRKSDRLKSTVPKTT